MNNNFVIFGYTISTKTILIFCIVAFILYLLFQGENFTDGKKTCSDIAPGNCTSELCAELSFCKPQKQENSDKCTCQERKDDD